MVAGQGHFAFSRFCPSYSIGRKREKAKSRSQKRKNAMSKRRKGEIFFISDFAFSTLHFRPIKYEGRNTQCPSPATIMDGQFILRLKQIDI